MNPMKFNLYNFMMMVMMMMMMMMMNIHLTLFENSCDHALISQDLFLTLTGRRSLCYINCPFRFYSKQSTLLLKEVVRHLK